jgi:hypothetical protein
MHENRIAQALELDRAGRIFEFREASSRPCPPSRGKSHNTEQKTTWNGSGWDLGTPERSMLKLPLIIINTKNINIWISK